MTELSDSLAGVQGSNRNRHDMGRARLYIPILFCLLHSAKVGFYLVPIHFRGPCDLLPILGVFCSLSLCDLPRLVSQSAIRQFQAESSCKCTHAMRMP